MRSLASALALLTIIPVPSRWLVRSGHPLGPTMSWFPLVGGLIGGALVGFATVFSHLFPPSVLSALMLSFWAGLTGCLHLDGFSDCCDALLAPVSPQRRLEILKDPRAGAFAVAGVTALLLTKYAALNALLQNRSAIVWLVMVPACSRWTMTLGAWWFPYARREGMGGRFREGLRWPQVLFATLSLMLLMGLIGRPLLSLWLGAGSLLYLALFGSWAARRLGGGLTGDVYGALNESVEVLCLLMIIGWNTLFG